MEIASREVGIVQGESSVGYFEFVVNPETRLKFGDFVVAKNQDGEYVLAVVRRVESSNLLLSEGHFTYRSLKRELELYEGVRNVDLNIARARVLGKIVTRRGRVVTPLPSNRIPIMNGETVYQASKELLESLYASGEGVKIGELLTREDGVEVTLDVDKLVSRHFAVLAVTGAGKSNTVSVIADEIVNRFGGTIIILDPHSEYITLRFPNGEKANVIAGKIRPEVLAADELATLVGIAENAKNQRDFFRRAYDTVTSPDTSLKARYNLSGVLGGELFLKAILHVLHEWEENGGGEYYDPISNTSKVFELRSEDKDPLAKVMRRIQSFLRDYGDILTSEDFLTNPDNGEGKVRFGDFNVIDLGGLDDDQMTVVANHLIKKTYETRVTYEKAKKRLEFLNGVMAKSPSELYRKEREEVKKLIENIETNYPALTEPVLIIIEEAHIFAPAEGRSEIAQLLGKIAREGRKFGIGLGIVSQRPKKLDPEVLSQANTKIILRLVEPEDQNHVRKASEQLSSDLLEDIASLGIGEAVVVGMSIALPALVRIDDFQKRGGRYGGKDIEIAKRWRKKREALKRKERKSKAIAGDLPL
ncbi:ATP-binding protein [Palaeococcus ferrophilus]|uniref:ATP-binding protein n=1 Tax=Palaeococcus ferrophilus TaxID=83868 RepID=UPI00064E2F5C|nr:ATP-binding protein [Palaeococcus ferrophilus]